MAERRGSLREIGQAIRSRTVDHVARVAVERLIVVVVVVVNVVGILRVVVVIVGKWLSQLHRRMFLWCDAVRPKSLFRRAQVGFLLIVRCSVWVRGRGS